MAEIATKIPALRFPQFEGEWKLKKVGETLSRVGTPVKVEKHINYQQIGIRSHGKGLFHKALVSGEDLGNKRVFWVESNAFIVNIVFAWEQAVAKTTSIEEGMIASHRFPMFQSQEKHPVDLDFVLHFFLTKKGKVVLEAASPGGAGRNKTLGQKEFERQKLFYPSLPEQQKIATFLTTIDTRIQQLSRKKALLEQYKKGVMQQIFSQEIRFKNEEGKEFPAWEEKRLGEIGDFIGGGTPDTQNSEYWNGDILWFTPTEVKEGILTTSKRKITEQGLRNSSAKLLPAGALLITTRATIGDIGIAKFPCTTNQGFQSLVVNKNQVNIFWYFWFLCNKNELIRLCSGSTFPEIGKNKIIQIAASVPTQPEQQKIAAFLTTIDRQINLASQQLNRMQTFKKGLLQQMFV